MFLCDHTYKNHPSPTFRTVQEDTCYHRFCFWSKQVVGNIWQSWSRSEVGCWRLDGVSVTRVPEVECWYSTAEPHQNCDPWIPGRFCRVVYRLDHQLARNVIQVFHETSRQLLKERKRKLTPDGHDIWVMSLVGLFEFRLYWDRNFDLRFHCSEDLLRCS